MPSDRALPVPRPPHIELGEGRDSVRIPILHEDRSVLAIDKPAGWLLVPFSWQSTQRNLAAALTSSIAARAFWARTRNLRFLRNVHRLDGDTTGILLLVKSLGAVRPYSDLFRSRQMEKRYLAVVTGLPARSEWVCRDRLDRDPRTVGRMRIVRQGGQEAETGFRVLQTGADRALIEARPLTGRTHQIRVHLHAAGHPVLGDELYPPEPSRRNPIAPPNAEFPLGLRAVALSYRDPFLRRPVRITAPCDTFLRSFGFGDSPAPRR